MKDVGRGVGVRVGCGVGIGLCANQTVSRAHSPRTRPARTSGNRPQRHVIELASRRWRGVMIQHDAKRIDAAPNLLWLPKLVWRPVARCGKSPPRRNLEEVCSSCSLTPACESTGDAGARDRRRRGRAANSSTASHRRVKATRTLRHSARRTGSFSAWTASRTTSMLCMAVG